MLKEINTKRLGIRGAHDITHECNYFGCNCQRQGKRRYLTLNTKNMFEWSRAVYKKNMFHSQGYFRFSLALSDGMYGIFVIPHATSKVKTHLQKGNN